MKRSFKELYSVELSDGFYEKAVRRFRNDPSIVIRHGDSFTFLQDLAPRLQEPVLYWLDAHYSGGETARGSKDTPIAEELDVCFAHWKKGSVILIDDGTLFDGTHESYPALEEIRQIAQHHNPDMRCVLEHDLIRIWEQRP